MSSIDEIIAAKEKATQIKRQKRLQDNREKEQQRKIITRRNIIVGGIISKYFPDIVRFQPKRTQALTNIEFAEFEMFVSLLAEDKDYVSHIQEKVRQNMLLNT